MLLQMTGVVEGFFFPFKHLGVPIISGRLKAIHLDDLVGKVKKRLEGWQNRLLSNGARLMLLKHVLMSLPIHLMSVIQVPLSVVRVLNRYFSNFFLGMIDGKPKKHWLAWLAVCQPVGEGGVGLRQLQDIQKSLHMKFSWKLLVDNSLLSNFFFFPQNIFVIIMFL